MFANPINKQVRKAHLFIDFEVSREIFLVFLNLWILESEQHCIKMHILTILRHNLMLLHKVSNSRGCMVWHIKTFSTFYFFTKKEIFSRGKYNFYFPLVTKNSSKHVIYRGQYVLVDVSSKRFVKRMVSTI